MVSGRYAAKVDQQIDSIKWYKDGREFYRLHPGRGGMGGVVRQFGVSTIPCRQYSDPMIQ